MRLEINVDNLTLVVEGEKDVATFLDAFGYDLGSFVDRAKPTNKNAAGPPLRTAPEPGAGKPVVQYPSKTDDGRAPLQPGPKASGWCQECGGHLFPLDEEAAIELYGIVVCLSCGKELE